MDSMIERILDRDNTGEQINFIEAVLEERFNRLIVDPISNRKKTGNISAIRDMISNVYKPSMRDDYYKKLNKLIKKIMKIADDDDGKTVVGEDEEPDSRGGGEEDEEPDSRGGGGGPVRNPRIGTPFS